MIGDIRVDAHLASHLVRSQFPELDPVHVEPLGEGCDSVAFAVNQTWVFRFPKRADVERQLLVEADILRALGRRGAPISVPAYWFHGRPSNEFPHHFGGYSRLAGTPGNSVNCSSADLQRLAPGLGRFLSWLHAFPFDEAIAMGVVDERAHDVIAHVRAETLEEFSHLSRVVPDAPLDTWRAFFEAGASLTRPTPSSFALVHNDLAADHVLVDASGPDVTGVIDWSDVAVGDRAIDLGGIFHWGGAAFLDDVLANYDGQVDEDLLSRARFFAAGRGVLDVAFGLECDWPHYVEGGLRAIRMAIGT